MTPDDARHAKAGPFCEIRRKRFGVPAFGEIVQLLVQHARELGQKGWNVPRRRMEGHRFSHAPTARTAARSMAIRASMFGR